MNQIEALGRLPVAPHFSENGRANLPDHLVKPLGELALLGEALAERLAASEKYNRQLKAKLRTLCTQVEASAKQPDELAAVIDDLLALERSRAEAMAPLEDQVARYREHAARLSDFVPQLIAEWNSITERAERTGINELEAVRDARLRLEIHRAKLINSEQPSSPVFDSADAALAYLRAQR